MQLLSVLQQDNIKFPGSTSLRIDPMLKLCSGCPLRVSENINVRAGVANGAQAMFQSLVLKHGDTLSRTTVDGVEIDCVFASQASHLLSKQHSSGNQSTFKLVPKKHAVNANHPKPEGLRSGGSKTEKIKMSAIQLPLISNNATTGHKLQGSSKDAIYIAKFTHHICDWSCVMLSRVQTRRGLFPRDPLDPLENFGSDPKLDAMTSRFRRLKAPAQLEHHQNPSGPNQCLPCVTHFFMSWSCTFQTNFNHLAKLLNWMALCEDVICQSRKHVT
jgi:hypothetical protein